MNNGQPLQEPNSPFADAIAQAVVDLRPQVRARRLRILHVDDDTCFLGVSKQILELEWQFEVEAATSVDEAFRKLSTEAFDAVVSDYQMPGKNGLDFLKELRERKNRIPFVLFTGKGREEVAIKALNLGADALKSLMSRAPCIFL